MSHLIKVLRERTNQNHSPFIEKKWMKNKEKIWENIITLGTIKIKKKIIFLFKRKHKYLVPVKKWFI